MSIVWCLLFLYGLLSELERTSKSFKTWITLNKPSLKIKGLLYKVNDSSLTFIPDNLITYEYDYNEGDFSHLKIEEIATVKIRRKGSIGKGILIGALV